jgi:hypothetical protein
MFAWRDGADILHGFRNLSSSLNEKNDQLECSQVKNRENSEK